MFAALALGAGAVYYSDNRDVTVLCARGDLAVGSTISDASVTLRRVRQAAVPSGTASDIAAVAGKYVVWPMLDGQYLPLRALADSRAGLIDGGLQPPPGYNAISVPVSPAGAAGGVLRPGDIVDVLAVARTQLSGASPAPAVTLGRRVMVLGLRTDQGLPLDPLGAAGASGRGLNLIGTHIGSAVIAVAPQDEAAYVAATATSTFTLVLDLG